MIQITWDNKRDIAAITAAWIADCPSDSAARASFLASYPTAQAWAQANALRWSYSYRDQFRTDAKTTAKFILGFTPEELTAIRAAAAVNPQLGAWLARIEEEPLIWLGSDEVILGKNALVAAGLLTQERADIIFFYEIPEMPNA